MASLDHLPYPSPLPEERWDGDSDSPTAAASDSLRCQTVEELLLTFGSNPRQNISLLLSFGATHLNCKHVSLEKADQTPADSSSLRLPRDDNDEVLVLAQPVTSPDQTKLAIFFSLLEQQEARLKDSTRVDALEKYTRTLFEACPDGIVVTDNYGFIIKANRAMTAIARKPVETLIGLRVSQLSDSKGRAQAFKALRRLRENNRARFDCRIKVTAERTIPVSISFRDFSFQDKPLILATVRDLRHLEDEVTRCTTYEQSLARSITNATDGFVRYDQFGRISEVNSHVETLTGVFEGRLVGRPVDDLLAVSSLRNFRKAVSRLNQTGYASFTCSVRHSSGIETPSHGTLIQFEIEGERYSRLMLQERPDENGSNLEQAET